MALFDAQRKETPSGPVSLFVTDNPVGGPDHRGGGCSEQPPEMAREPFDAATKPRPYCPAADSLTSGTVSEDRSSRVEPETSGPPPTYHAFLEGSKTPAWQHEQCGTSRRQTRPARPEIPGRVQGFSAGVSNILPGVPMFRDCPDYLRKRRARKGKKFIESGLRRLAWTFSIGLIGRHGAEKRHGGPPR